jgi:hypothetical protein
MALSEDQKAMLKLVSQPDTSYEDIAALMGLSVEEVREKVDDALAQIDAGGSAPAAEPEPPKPEPEKPKPEPAATPQAASKPAPAPKPTAATKQRKPSPKLPEDKGARYAIFAGVAVIVVLVLLLVTGALDGGDDESGSAARSNGDSQLAAGERTPTQAVLEPVGGADAAGRALFGRAGKQVVLLLRVKGLDPAPSGRSYTVSISKGSGDRVPLIASLPNKNREIVGSFKIAAQILGLLASGYDTMEVSLVPNGELGQALTAAQKTGTAPTYGGVDVARGEVTGPIVEAGEG